MDFEPAPESLRPGDARPYLIGRPVKRPPIDYTVHAEALAGSISEIAKDVRAHPEAYFGTDGTYIVEGGFGLTLRFRPHPTRGRPRGSTPRCASNGPAPR